MAAIKKSTKPTTTLLAGTTRRGKYIFDTRFELVTRLLPLSDNAVEKNCQGSSPQKENNAIGAPPVGDLLILLNIVKASIIRHGRMSAQAIPTTVCLYRIKKSRHARKKNNSR